MTLFASYRKDRYFIGGAEKPEKKGPRDIFIDSFDLMPLYHKQQVKLIT